MSAAGVSVLGSSRAFAPAQARLLGGSPASEPCDVCFLPSSAPSPPYQFTRLLLIKGLHHPGPAEGPAVPSSPGPLEPTLLPWRRGPGPALPRTKGGLPRLLPAGSTRPPPAASQSLPPGHTLIITVLRGLGVPAPLLSSGGGGLLGPTCWPKVWGRLPPAPVGDRGERPCWLCAGAPWSPPLPAQPGRCSPETAGMEAAAGNGTVLGPGPWPLQLPAAPKAPSPSEGGHLGPPHTSCL